MVSYAIPRDQLLASIRYDCEVFFGFYLGEQLELAVPEMHKELWDELLDLLDQVDNPERLTGVLKKLIAIPREHAKTTIIKLAVLLFMRYSRLSFCAYTSNTVSAALNALRDIRNWFMSERDQALYGKATVVKSSETEALFILDICVPGRSRLKRVILKGFGQGTQIRGTLIEGQRPDFLVFDDIESRETADSPLQQAKLDTWCLGTALPALGRIGLCVMIGNMISDTTLLARLSKEPEWNPTVLGSIVKAPDGTLCPLWPGRWTLEALLEDYAAYRRLGQGHVWEAERMNLTAKEILGESLENAILLPRPMPEEIEAGFLCLDPAFGLKSWNDESAITVHVRIRGGDIPMLAESLHDKWGPDRLFEEMLAASMRWGIRTWAIEAQAAQVLLIPYFKALMTQRKLNQELILMIPIMAGKEAKASRIVSFRSAVAVGSYAVADSERELLKVLEEYTPGNGAKDDLPDSAAYGLQVWALHNEVVRGQGVGDVAGLLFGSHGATNAVTGVDMLIP